MKPFKLTFMTALLALLAFSTITQVAYAEETTTEKIKVKAHDAKRAIRKSANRVEEIICMKGDVKCASMKMKNRTLEAKDATVDGVKEIKNKID